MNATDRETLLLASPHGFERVGDHWRAVAPHKAVEVSAANVSALVRQGLMSVSYSTVKQCHRWDGSGPEIVTTRAGRPTWAELTEEGRRVVAEGAA